MASRLTDGRRCGHERRSPPPALAACSGDACWLDRRRGDLAPAGSATDAWLLSGLGGGLGRLGGGLLMHGRLELLLAGEGGGELVGVLERPAN
jgi:hypothetical protein